VYRETNPLFATYVYLWEKLIPVVYRKNRFAVISPSTKDDLVKRGIRAERIDVVLCGLDHESFRVLDGVARFEEPTLIHFGRIRKYKSVNTVINAFAAVKEKLPGARLLIVGDGPEKPSLVAQVDRMGLSGSTEFTGVVSGEKLVELLNKAHVFLNASPKEGWGLTVVEANACGLPVVASRRPGLKDSVKDGKTGYLVEYGDVDGFAARALELLTEPSKWRQMSRAGLEWARSLTWDQTGLEMQAIFLEEIERSRSAKK
jgi:glycosyltransferase involved in cell wall biosynthesis